MKIYLTESFSKTRAHKPLNIRSINKMFKINNDIL